MPVAAAVHMTKKQAHHGLLAESELRKGRTMAQKQKLQNSGMQIPDDAILRIAQAMLPLMQQYFESEEGRLQLSRQTEALEQKEAAPASQPAPPLIFAHYLCVDIKIINPNPSPIRKKFGFINNGDPYGNRTHVTAVKGRCLNRLTNGPGSGNLIRTDDIPGMNRLLYQLSYAAMCGQRISAPPKSASLLYPKGRNLSSNFFVFSREFLAILPSR